MKPKEYLQRVAHAEREIRTLKAKVAHFEDLGLRITTASGDAHIRPSTPSSRVETAAVGIVDALEDINANLRAYAVIVSDAEKLIRKVPQENYRRILTLRYLCGWKLPKIGEELRYTDRNSIYRAHGWALLEFGKVLRAEGGAADDRGRPDQVDS